MPGMRVRAARRLPQQQQSDQAPIAQHTGCQFTDASIEQRFSQQFIEQ